MVFAPSELRPYESEEVECLERSREIIIKQKMPQKFETIIEWEAPEFRHYPKNTAWYITLGVITSLLVAYEAFQKDWFGVISLAIIAGFVAMFARHTPRIISIQISDKGIHWGDTYIPYTHIKYFWVVDDGVHKTLNIETTAYVNHLHSIELDEQDPEFIRDILVEFLDEHEEPEPTLVQRIAHRFKF